MEGESRESDSGTRLLENPQLNAFNGDLHCNRSASRDSALTLTLVISVLVAVSGTFAYGCSAGYSSPVESEIMTELGLSSAEFSLFGSMLTAGALLGALVSGKTMDFIGRRGAMALSDIFFLVGWAAIFFSQGAWSLDFGRFMVGFGGGIQLYAVPVYVAEIAPKNIRGGAVFLGQLMVCCGISLMFFTGLVIDWCPLALIGMLPCLIQLLGLYYIPASPRYLANLGRDKESEAALRCLRGDRADISREAYDIEEYTKANGHTSQVQFLHLFQRKYAYVLTVGTGLVALSQLGGANGILFYAGDIFESAGSSTTFGTVGMAIIQIPASALGVYLMDKAGRRPLAMSSAAGLCFCCLLVGLSFLMKELNFLEGATPYLVLIGILGYSTAYPLAMGGVPFVLIAEIYPTNIKGSAGSLANVVCWSTSWIVSYAFSFMMQWSSSGAFFILAGVNAFTILFIAKLVPETKGRTLEEIQGSVINTMH